MSLRRVSDGEARKLGTAAKLRHRVLVAWGVLAPKQSVWRNFEGKDTGWKMCKSLGVSGLMCKNGW
jgi:hypothetical protein